jgi:hypothetical protein
MNCFIHLHYLYNRFQESFFIHFHIIVLHFHELTLIIFKYLHYQILHADFTNINFLLSINLILIILLFFLNLLIDYSGIV